MKLISLKNYLSESIDPDEYNETQQESCSLFISRLSPLHSGHVEIIKSMTNPVIALIKGEKSSKDKNKNPFPLWYQKQLLKEVFPDIKIEVANSGFLPFILNDLRTKGLEVTKLYAGSDRIKDYKKQLKDFNEEVPENKQASIKFKETPRLTSGTEIRDILKRASETKTKQEYDATFDEFKDLMPEELWDQFDKMISFVEKGVIAEELSVSTGNVAQKSLPSGKIEKRKELETDEEESKVSPKVPNVNQEKKKLIF